MILLKNLIPLIALIALFFSCNKKDGSTLESEINNNIVGSTEKIKEAYDNKSVIIDSATWNQYKIIREVDVEDTLPYQNCKIVLINDNYLKYYIKNKIELEDSIKVKNMSSDGNILYELKSHDSCLFFNKSKQIIEFSSCNPNASFVSEYFRKEYW